MNHLPKKYGNHETRGLDSLGTLLHNRSRCNEIGSLGQERPLGAPKGQRQRPETLRQKDCLGEASGESLQGRRRGKLGSRAISQVSEQGQARCECLPLVRLGSFPRVTRSVGRADAPRMIVDAPGGHADRTPSGE